MSGAQSDHQDVDIDLLGLFRAVWARRRRVLLATVAVTGLAFIGTSLMAPDYRSETRLLIESREPAFSSGSQQAQQGAQPAFDDQAIASQVQILQSVDLIKQVARNMKLYELEEFDPTANPSAISDILVMLGLKSNPLDEAPEERVLKEFTEKLQVYQVEKSRVVAIQFTSKDPKLAAAIPNEMAKVYLDLQSGAKLDTNSEATRWLEPEIANLREKVRDAEAKVAAYRSSSDLLPTGQTGNFASQQLNDISLELARLRGEKANAMARAEGVRSALAAGRAPDTLADVVGSQLIQRLKETETTLQGQIADLSTSLLDGHPRLKGLKSQLRDVRQQIEQESRKILASLQNEAKTAELREQELVKQLNTLKAASAQAGEAEVGLNALEREATAQRQLLETYLARYREATSRTAEAATPADARMVSRAVVPTEVHFPKVLPITIVAGLATFLAYSVAIMLAELFSGRALRPVGAGSQRQEPAREDRPVPATPPARDREQDTAMKPAPAARSLLSAAGEDDRPAARPEQAVVDDTADYTIESVADHLLDSGAPLALVVSPGGDAGSTATVLLARTLAEGGRRIVLIDLTGSACPTRLMAPAADLPGITDLLTGNAAFSDTIHADRLSEADIIPQGTADAARAMRGVDRLRMILQALWDAYDVVLVECGPADARALSRIAPSLDTDIIISAGDMTSDTIVAAVVALAEAGHTEIALMSGSSTRRSGPARRRAA